MDLYETAVMYFLVANGETFIAPHINLGHGAIRPNFIAIRPSKRTAYVVDVTSSGDQSSLIEKMKANKNKWITLLKKHIEKRGIADPKWSYKVLLFIRSDQRDQVKQKLGRFKKLHVLCLENAVESWRWNKQVWTSDFSFEAEAQKAIAS